MFYYLNGILSHLEPGLCVVDCGGVGYQLTLSLITAQSLVGKEGSPIKLYTHLAVREDGMELFGFGSDDERRTFHRLLTVSGVGPKAAMSLLSAMTPEKLALSICTEDIKGISKAQGIGAKTAARIVLELKDKMAKDYASSPVASASTAGASAANVSSGNLSEAMEALLVLGYDKPSITTVLRGMDPLTDVSTLIRQALKKLSSR
ncbi:MAG: Holliday junction branch migration protein RuvA [Clostridia bacterium]|nr:Holliday junction branch migration protein RuvA [Clostridia bacterium]